jgi:hypothetical protein
MSKLMCLIPLKKETLEKHVPKRLISNCTIQKKGLRPPTSPKANANDASCFGAPIGIVSKVLQLHSNLSTT